MGSTGGLCCVVCWGLRLLFVTYLGMFEGVWSELVSWEGWSGGLLQ